MAGIEEDRFNQLRQMGLISKKQQKNYGLGQKTYGAGGQFDKQYASKLKQNSAGLMQNVRVNRYSAAGGAQTQSVAGMELIAGNPPEGGPWPVTPVRPLGPVKPGKSKQSDSQALIDSIYEKLRESQLAALEGQYTQQVNDYNKQKGEAPEKFNPLRNEAYVNSEMAERSRKESMANMGLSGAGGMSQTLKQRNTGNLLNTLGNISRQQQDYTDNIDFALSQLAAQYGSSKNSINLQIDSEKNRAFLDQGNWEKNFGLQEKQFGLSQSDSEFNRYIQLLNKGVINKKQFKAKFPELF